MTKPLSNFLKAPAQNSDNAVLSVVTAESEAHAADSNIVHTETEYIAADTAVLYAEPMMTTPLSVKSVPVEPVVVRPENTRAAKQQHTSSRAARESVAQPAKTAVAETPAEADMHTPVNHMVATAKIASAKSLAVAFKPAMNVKPSVFIKQEQEAAGKAAQPASDMQAAAAVVETLAVTEQAVTEFEETPAVAKQAAEAAAEPEIAAAVVDTAAEAEAARVAADAVGEKTEAAPAVAAAVAANGEVTVADAANQEEPAPVAAEIETEAVAAMVSTDTETVAPVSESGEESGSNAREPVTHIVATARIASAKSLAAGFKPATNVKPSFVKQQHIPAEQQEEKAADRVAEEQVKATVTLKPVENAAAATVLPAEQQGNLTADTAADGMKVELAVAAAEETVEKAVQTVDIQAIQAVDIPNAAESSSLKTAADAAADMPADGSEAGAGGKTVQAAAKTADAQDTVKPSSAKAGAGAVAAAAPKAAIYPETAVPAAAAVVAKAKGKAAAFKSAVKPIRAAISALPAVAAAGRFWQNKPVRWSILGVLLPVSGMVAAYAVNDPNPEKELYRAERVMEELPSVYVESGIVHGSYWVQEAVQPGDSLTDILSRIGMSDDNIRQVLAHSSIDRDLIQLRAGQSVNVRFDASGDITDVQFFNDDDNGFRDLVAIEKVNGKWGASTSAIDMETMPTLRAVQVRTSARGALAQAGVPVEIRESLNEIFSDAVNVEELGEGDSIRLLYNSLYFRGQEMATGDILAAEVVKGGKTYQAYYYSQGKGDEESGSYYDQHGKALHLADGFNVKPVEYTRISSPYGTRVHPVLHTVKMHTGIDYAAPTGTPIRAAADGMLTFKGWKGGYGNTVVLMHSNGIETLYAHMSAFSPAQGKVKAGDVIGYVGSTGRSTGPHLHYEVRKNGQHMNPTAIALPTPKLTPANIAEFRKIQAEHSATLAAVRNLPVSVTQLD